VKTFLPSSPLVLAAVLLAFCAWLLLGFLLQRRLFLSWLLAVVGVAGMHLGLLREAAGFRMAALMILLCYGMKAVVVAAARRGGMPLMTFGNWLAFAAVWFGMQPRQFLARRLQPIPGAAILFFQGLLWLAAGGGTFFLARHLHEGGFSLRIAGLVFVAGFAMTLHFGIIPVLAAAFRSLGYNAGPQFHAPWQSTSLQDFWSRRWNVAFSVMTTLVVYRPMARHAGRGGALFLGFLASGLFHEVACSLPVRAGYGLPTAYFALHGIGVLLERWLHRRRTPLTGGLITRVWVYAWVLLPLPLLFHLPILRGVVLPLL